MSDSESPAHKLLALYSSLLGLVISVIAVAGACFVGDGFACSVAWIIGTGNALWLAWVLDGPRV